MPGMPKAVIFGCQGPTLTAQEADFFRRTQPLGFILFSRNCHTPEQIKALIHSLKDCVDHDYVPILIDQEGGRVQRLKPPYWRRYPPSSLFGLMADDDLETALWACETNAFILGSELAELGINVNCSPVLDLPLPDAHPIISDRALHDSPEIAVKLALSIIRGLARSGITAILKHIPGHGRAYADSHIELPIVSTSLSDLEETDFASFRLACQNLQNHTPVSPWAMTAHICYSAIDDIMPATLSPTVISNIIRAHIGFNGLLISDCLTMKALEGALAERAELCLKAGCDIALHCSGNLSEMIEVASATTPLSQDNWVKCQASLIPPPLPKAETLETLYATLQAKMAPYTKTLDTHAFEVARIGE